MQTIPNRVLDAIAAAKPWTKHVIDKLRADPDQVTAPQLETWIAQQAMIGNIPAGLSGLDIRDLSAVYYGHPWGGDWVRLADASAMTGYDDSHLRRLAGAGELPAIKRGKTWYIRRDALPKKEP